MLFSAFFGYNTATSLDFRTNAFSEPPYNGFTILRPKFDRWLASEAEVAGALLITATVVDELLYKDEQVVGVRCRREDGDLYAPIVIAADGANPFLAKKAGLQQEFRADEMTLGVKEVLRLDAHTIEECFNLNGDEDMTNEYVGDASGDVRGVFLKGDGGGIIFRDDSKRPDLYYLYIAENSAYDLNYWPSGTASGAILLLSGTSSDFFHDQVQNGRKSLVAIAANGRDISVYIDGTYAKSTQDSRIAGGRIALTAQKILNDTEVIYD